MALLSFSLPNLIIRLLILNEKYQTLIKKKINSKNNYCFLDVFSISKINTNVISDSLVLIISNDINENKNIIIMFITFLIYFKSL